MGQEMMYVDVLIVLIAAVYGHGRVDVVGHGASQCDSSDGEVARTGGRRYACLQGCGR